MVTIILSGNEEISNYMDCTWKGMKDEDLHHLQFVFFTVAVSNYAFERIIKAIKYGKILDWI